MDYMTRLAILDSAAQRWEKTTDGYRSSDGHSMKKNAKNKWVLTTKDGRSVELKQATFPGAEKALAELNRG